MLRFGPVRVEGAHDGARLRWNADGKGIRLAFGLEANGERCDV